MEGSEYGNLSVSTDISRTGGSVQTLSPRDSFGDTVRQFMALTMDEDTS